MARLTTMPAPAVTPCQARQNHSWPMLVASRQPSEASANSSSAASITRRRP
jgi:hypothetical protein